MIESSVARRYSRALLALALEEGKGADAFGAAEQFGAQLEAVRQALEASREARSVLLHPGYSLQQRHKVIDSLAQGLELREPVVSFLRLLVDRQRIDALPLIARVYGEMVDHLAGRVRAVVTSAQPLAEGDLARVGEALSHATQRRIVLEAKTDPAIVGGVVAQVGGTVFDGSLRTQLERLREELKQSPV